ncbi:MAG: DEAD/DEAH box helicase [Kiritimatiellae bacterium]|nr:DEAD/DEAH box helicase [Kiritimatiellia bacterium]
MSFIPFSLHATLMANLSEQGFSKPTPIQKETIGLAIEGHDVMGLAQTGTGKTAAFLLPILQRLGQTRRIPRALIVVPTRELAEQIRAVFEQLGKGTGLRWAMAYGGVGINPQITKLKKGVDVVIACPGRLLDHIERGTVDLSKIEVLVLDEADRMFDMGFLPDIRRIVKKLPAERQTLLFSATMPENIRSLARDVMRDPKTVEISHSMPPATVTHALFAVSDNQYKTPLLLALLKQIDRDSVLIFTRTKYRAERLTRQLISAGHRTTSLQGNLSQGRRKAAMDGFREGTFRIMVATDIASRGLDVSSISHVINYDIPAHVDDYVHRIGRTGRAAKDGDAFTFVTPDDADLVRAIEKRMGSRLARRILEGFKESEQPNAHLKKAKPAGQAAKAHKSSGQRRHFGPPRSGGRRR